jgi:hypothetical protein
VEILSQPLISAKLFYKNFLPKKKGWRFLDPKTHDLEHVSSSRAIVAGEITTSAVDCQ